MSSPRINYPAQPTYADSLAESLDAHINALRGTGQFKGTGGLQNVTEQFDTPFQLSQAQAATDVTARTLEGGEVPDYEAYVMENPEVLRRYNAHVQNQNDPRTMEQFGRDNYRMFGRAEGLTLPTKRARGMVDLVGDTRMLEGQDRRAGFDEQGNFIGTAAFLEDIGAAQQSRARERDLADVERLAPRYKDVMDAFRDENLMTSIGEVGGTQDVFMRDMAEQRAGDEDDTEAAPINAKDNPYQFMLNDIMEDQQSDLAQLAEQEAGGRMFDPDMTAETINNEYLMRLDQLNKSYPEEARKAQGVAGDVGDAGPMGDAGDPFTARLAQAGTPSGAGLRETLTNEALLGLRGGLTPREERQIAEAARARATMMGRTFDQSEAIREAQARVLEDNQRRKENLAIAQNVLGQETGTRFRELALKQQSQLDPISLVLGRQGTPTTGQASQLFGQAGYGMDARPSYINPSAGLGFIQNQATNAANMAIADQSARATARAGLYQGIGSALGGGLRNTDFSQFGKCWVAREVYGAHNPAWLLFRNWLDTKAPRWFDKLYLKFGERFAKFISDKPRLKARIRLWMDTKIRR